MFLDTSERSAGTKTSTQMTIIFCLEAAKLLGMLTTVHPAT